MSNKTQWTAKELAKHISSHVLSVDAIEHLIKQLLEHNAKIAFTDASGIYKDVPCSDWWPEFKLQNNL